MNIGPDDGWCRDDTIRADTVSVGLARNAETGEVYGVAAVFSVPVVSGEPMRVSVVMNAEQTVKLANCLFTSAIDIAGVEVINGEMP